MEEFFFFLKNVYARSFIMLAKQFFFYGLSQ